MASMMPRLILVAVTIAVLSFFAAGTPIGEDNVIRVQRGVDSNVTAVAQEPLLCLGPTPCGWAVYTTYDRAIDYFMKNVCECAKNLSCLRATDDLSARAFVYRCQLKNPPATT